MANAMSEAREKLGLTQTDLAKALGYENPSAVNRMESGTRPISRRTALALEALITRQERGLPLTA